MSRHDRLSSEQVRSLYVWWDSVPRKTPDAAFTSGILRQVAELMEEAAKSSGDGKEKEL